MSDEIDPEKPSMDDTNYDVYTNQRNGFDASYRDGEKTLDTWLLTLSGGALGLSMTFLKDIAGGHPAAWISLLAFAWSMLGTSILCVLVNLYKAPKMCLKSIEALDYCMKNYRSHCFLDDVRSKQEKEPVKWFDLRNVLAASTFIIGIVCLGIFLMKNLG